MSNDGKLGLLAGIATVLLIAVVSYRKSQSVGPPPGLLPTPQRSAVPQTPPAVSVIPSMNSIQSPGDPLLRSQPE